MTDVKWTIKAREFANCNCSYGCPCQFNGLPTHGHCRAVVGIEIDEGHHGDTRLDGLKVRRHFPMARRHSRGQGRGRRHRRRARDSQAQRDALLRILSGQDTEPGATIFNVFASTLEKTASADLQPDRFRGRRRRAAGASRGAGHDRDPRRADPQSGDRQRAPGAHRHGGRLRIHARRDRARLVEDDATDRLRAVRFLRPVRHIYISARAASCADAP